MPPVAVPQGIVFWDGDQTRVNDPVGKSADRLPLERVTVRQGIEIRSPAPALRRS